MPAKAKEGNQKTLRGNPQLVGLTSVEYLADERIFSANAGNLRLIEGFEKEDADNNYRM